MNDEEDEPCLHMVIHRGDSNHYCTSCGTRWFLGPYSIED